MSDFVDILAIGGGVNGTGIARDAAGRGLKVMLCEKDDLAQHTSSASTKLIHGGLRYLEYYEFRLVRESLIEREVLLRSAPHIIWPMRFVLPHHKGLRAAWLIRMGLFLYDHLGGRKLLPPTKRRDFKTTNHGKILDKSFKFGFEYSDCWVEDSRLVVLNAMDAEARGAKILTRTECVALKRDGEHWLVTLKDANGVEQLVHARTIVNAAGPWVDKVLYKTHNDESDRNLRLIKGSHLITRKLFEGETSYILQNADNRIVFAIPYERDFTLIGTTDVPYTHDEGLPTISEAETSYLIDVVNEYFQQDISVDDIVATYSGVRPLYDDQAESASVVTRDYVLDLDGDEKTPPILSVFGGKITTFRKLSEQAVDKLEPFVKPSQPGHWTRGVSLPGGDIKDTDFQAFERECKKRWHWMPDAVLRRLLRAYGTCVDRVIGDASSMADLGRDFGLGLTEAEVRYLVEEEFVSAPNDILFRRSKLHLHMTEQEKHDFISWFEENYSSENSILKVTGESQSSNLANDDCMQKEGFDDVCKTAI